LEELRGLNGIVRYAIGSDCKSKDQQLIFKPDLLQNIRRLGSFALLGHQTAINGWCTTTAAEKKSCEEAIAKQRMGANPKAWRSIKAAKEAAAAKGTIASIKLKKVRINNAAVANRKKRSKMKAENKVERPSLQRGITPLGNCNAQNAKA
jgi:hypothetical protein